jgi:serine/threonine protein phosphatase PrpC
MAGDEDRESLYVRLDEVSTHVELDNNERLRDLFMQRNIVPGVLAHVPGSFRSAVSVQEHDCETGDVFVICSDGVHDNLTGTEIQATIEEKLSGGATAIVEALTSKAWLRSQEDHVRAKPDDISAACLIG